MRESSLSFFLWRDRAGDFFYPKRPSRIPWRSLFPRRDRGDDFYDPKGSKKERPQPFLLWRDKGGIRPWLYLPLAFCSLALLDIVLRAVFAPLASHPGFPAPLPATLCWCAIWVGLASLLPGRLKKVYLALVYLFFAVLTLTHTALQHLFHRFFLFSTLAFAADGASFADRSYIRIDLPILLAVLGGLLLMALAIALAPGKQTRVSYAARFLIGVVLMLVGGFGIVVLQNNFLVSKDGPAWNGSDQPSYIYERFTDSTNALLLSGLYQYTFRDITLSLGLQTGISNVEREALLEYVAARRLTYTKNAYTDRFQGKNLILIQLEAIDTWMLDEAYMPNLARLKQDSIVFSNHFTPAYITAGTLNTEFIVNTGLLPAMGTLSSLVYEQNAFPYSLASQFTNAGYTAESFHGSDGKVYNRSALHPNWGYERYHSGEDMGMESYMLDRFLMSGYDDMVRDTPFFSFIITYSGHGPYSAENGIYRAHTEQAEEAAKRTEDNYVYAVGHAMETDLFIGELVKKLEADGRLDDTVLAFYADHYNYYMMNDDLSKKIKGVDSLNRLQQTDFFIYAKGEPPRTVEKVTSSLDVLPTLSNLFGLDAAAAVYLGNDAFSYIGGYTFFSDGSLYDGEREIPSGGDGPPGTRVRFVEIADALHMSQLLLKSDYFRLDPPRPAS